MYSLNKPTMTTTTTPAPRSSEEICAAKGRNKQQKQPKKKAPVGRRQSGCCSSCAVLCEHVLCKNASTSRPSSQTPQWPPVPTLCVFGGGGWVTAYRCWWQRGWCLSMTDDRHTPPSSHLPFLLCRPPALLSCENQPYWNTVNKHVCHATLEILLLLLLSLHFGTVFEHLLAWGWGAISTRLQQPALLLLLSDPRQKALWSPTLSDWPPPTPGYLRNASQSHFRKSRKKKIGYHPP